MLKKSLCLLSGIGVSLLMLGSTHAADLEKTLKEKGHEGTFALFRTSMGDFAIELYKEKVPMTVDNFIGLATGEKGWVDPKTKKRVSKPFYNGLIFHRVIKGFMIQGGCPLGNGRGDPGYKFKDEFNRDLKHNVPGILSMANSGPNTNGSQFFITVAPTPHLDFKHTVFGKVVLNYEIVDRISRTATASGNVPLKAVVLKEIEIVEID